MTLFRVATFNVNSVRSRMAVLRRWLASNPVDVLCLQETKVVDEVFPVEDFREMGYHVAFRGQKAYNGVAIASLMEPSELVFGFQDGQEEDPETRLIRARFGDVDVVNTYVPQGKSLDHADYQYKLDFFVRLDRLFSGPYSNSSRLLWVGDMNVAPTERDVTNPKTKRDHVCFHVSIREAFRAVTEGRFVDVFRKHRPEDGEFTFWDYRVKNALTRNIGWRIDHIMASPALADLSVDCYADREPRAWEKPSDHTVVVAAFDL